jgi:hypothetical protein
MLVAGTLSEHTFWCQVSTDRNFCRTLPLAYKALQAVRVLMRQDYHYLNAVGGLKAFLRGFAL